MRGKPLPCTAPHIEFTPEEKTAIRNAAQALARAIPREKCDGVISDICKRCGCIFEHGSGNFVFLETAIITAKEVGIEMDPELPTMLDEMH